MKTFLNYLGQLRLYSLVDLILLLVALQTEIYQLVGAVMLHITFLAYLESRHAHNYRAKVPGSVSYILSIVGLIFYRKVEGFLYLVTSYLYTKKTKDLGRMSPFFRAIQNFFIVAGIVGYVSSIPYIVAVIFFLRNLIGDFRDIEKDKMEGVKTIPVILGLKKSIAHIHLLATMATSVIWWIISPLSVIWLAIVILIQASTYYLTPR
jgi:4-hydroxybenzoate polyprenyltransferase